MATVTPEVVPSRRERQPETREAVQAALKMLGGRLSAEKKRMNHEKILDTIKNNTLGPKWIDHVDVAGALRWLHAHEIVRISGYDERTGDKIYRIRVLPQPK